MSCRMLDLNEMPLLDPKKMPLLNPKEMPKKMPLLVLRRLHSTTMEREMTDFY
jgi:hypothetical protein